MVTGERRKRARIERRQPQIAGGAGHRGIELIAGCDQIHLRDPGGAGTEYGPSSVGFALQTPGETSEPPGA